MGFTMLGEDLSEPKVKTDETGEARQLIGRRAADSEGLGDVPSGAPTTTVDIIVRRELRVRLLD